MRFCHSQTVNLLRAGAEIFCFCKYNKYGSKLKYCNPDWNPGFLNLCICIYLSPYA